MNTNEILKEIDRLPIRKRIYLIEKMLQSIRKKEEFSLMETAAEILYSNYKNDTELSVFTDIDLDGFYETK